MIVAHAAPTPDHGAIASNLAGILRNGLRGHPAGCRSEVGSGAAPKREQRNTARIPDITIRCGEHPRVMFEVISPSELWHWQPRRFSESPVRDQKRRDLQDVEGVAEIVELYQREPKMHVCRRAEDGSWSFEAIGA